MNVVYVDANDNVIGAGSIANARENGIRVRISRIILLNSKGKILLQKRSDNHDSLPGRWDQTAAGHVNEGEGYKQAAIRELFEEMGINGVELVEIAKYYSEEKDEAKIKKRFNKLFVGRYDGIVKIDNHEVSDFAWLEPNELEMKIKSSPQEFTEGCIDAFKIFMTHSKTN